MKFTINTNDFKSAVKRLATVAINGTLSTTSAIQFEYDGKEMLMTTNNLQQQRTIKINIPHEALKMIDSLDGTFTVVAITDKYMLMVCGVDVLTTKLIEGNFPNWKQVVPEKTMYKYKTDTKHFIKEIKQVQKIVKAMEADADMIQFTLNDCNVGMLPLKHNYNTRSDETVGIEHVAQMEYTATELMPETFTFKFKFDMILPILESFDSDVKFGITLRRAKTFF